MAVGCHKSVNICCFGATDRSSWEDSLYVVCPIHIYHLNVAVDVSFGDQQVLGNAQQ